MKKSLLYRMKIGTANFREHREFTFVGERPPMIEEVRLLLSKAVEDQAAYCADPSNFENDDDECPEEDAKAELDSLKLVLEVARLAQRVPATKSGSLAENIRVAGTTVGTIRVTAEEVYVIPITE